MTPRDGHIRVLPLHVANKIAAGEVVERPASVVKELVENAIDAGSKSIQISITQGGRKLISVQDDGCGMTRDDAILSLERQATSKILDVNDIEEIDTLGFRGEAIPSIASVSRFSIITRRHDNDEGTCVVVNAGVLNDVSAAGCPAGTRIEVRDLFCNVPARRKFLRSFTTEESHIRHIFTVHALAHPNIAFALTTDAREQYRLAPAPSLIDRVRDLFGEDFANELLPIELTDNEREEIRISGYIEKPNLNEPTRRDQYIFVNGRPASAPSIAYAIKEAYPRRQGDVRPATILYIDLPPNQVDVNVHPTKREVRFRDNVSIKRAIINALTKVFSGASSQTTIKPPTVVTPPPTVAAPPPAVAAPTATVAAPTATVAAPTAETPAPVQIEFAVDPSSSASKPWCWFKVLAQTSTGYILLETDAGLVTLDPRAARERIAYEGLIHRREILTQNLLIPDIMHFSPADSARLKASIPALLAMGFTIEDFGQDTFKLDAVPLLARDVPPAALLTTIVHDLAETRSHTGEKWREERIAKSIAKSFAGMSLALSNEDATKLVEELCSCRMPYVCPRGKPIMIFTSTRELNRKFAKQ